MVIPIAISLGLYKLVFRQKLRGGASDSLHDLGHTNRKRQEREDQTQQGSRLK